MAKRGIFKWFGTQVDRLKGRIHTFGTNAWEKFFSFVDGGKEEDSGEIVTAESGTRINIVFNCLNILAQDIATFPKTIRKDTSEGKTAIKNKLHHLINHRPNKWENAWHFWYGMVFVGEGWGNSYAYIADRDAQGYATEMIRLKPWLVNPQIVEGELVYVIDNKVSIPSYNMLHYRSMVTESPIGEQKLTYNAKTVGLKLKQQKYSSKSVGNKPPGIIFGDLSQEQLDANQKIWNSQVSGDNIAGTPFLNGELKYQQMMMSPEATEIIQQHQLSDQYLMGIWRMQPAMLSMHEKSNYNVVEQQNINHVKYALNPIIVNLEQEIDNKLFPAANWKREDPEYVKFNVKSLLRGDTATQTAFYQFGTTNGIFNADEVRDWEDLSPQRDSKGKVGIGRKYFIQGAMVDKENPVLPNTGADSDQKQMDLLDEFLKKHKLNGYSVTNES